MTALATIDQNAFRKRVEDHILNTFGSLIPEDQFKAMIDSQVKDFFDTKQVIQVVERQEEVKDTRGYYSGTRKWMELSVPITPFQQMVWSVLMKLVDEKLNQEFSPDNKDNPVNKFLHELFHLPEFESNQVMTTQRMMIALAGSFFEKHLQSVGYDAKQSIAQALYRVGLSEAANSIEAS